MRLLSFYRKILYLHIGIIKTKDTAAVVKYNAGNKDCLLTNLGYEQYSISDNRSRVQAMD